MLENILNRIYQIPKNYFNNLYDNPKYSYISWNAKTFYAKPYLQFPKGGKTHQNETNEI